MKHLNSKQIRIYLSDDLSYEKRLEIETHIAECPQCADRVRAHYSARAHFDDLWDSWALSTHIAEFEVLRITETIRNTKIKSSLRSRVESWSKTIHSGVEVALGVTIDASERLVGIVRDGFDFLNPEIDAGTFNPIPSPVSIQGDADFSHWMSFEAVGPPWIRVTADSHIGRVLVQLQSSKKPWPLVALVAKDGTWATVDVFRDVEGETFLLVEFDDIPSGEFLVIIEKNPSLDFPQQ